MPVRRHMVPQIVTKKNAGTSMEAPLNYDIDSKGSGGSMSRPASTNPGSPAMKKRPTRQQTGRGVVKGG